VKVERKIVKTKGWWGNEIVWERITYDVTNLKDSTKSKIIDRMLKKGFVEFRIGWEGNRQYYIFWRRIK